MGLCSCLGEDRIFMILPLLLSFLGVKRLRKTASSELTDDSP